MLDKYIDSINIEFNNYRENPEQLLKLLDNVNNVTYWLFSKDSEMIEPYPYSSEIDGHNRGTFSKKKFLSFEDASNKNFFIYGFNQEKGIVKVISTSYQFGTSICFYVYDGDLVKIISMMLKNMYLEKEGVSYSPQNSIPKLMGIKYVFKDRDTHFILNKGISSKNVSIQNIKYENGFPTKLISNDNIEYDLNFDNKQLKEIKHRDSGFYIYKCKKTRLV